MTVRIATWNVWWRFGDWERRGEAIASELARVEADVVCLQEVWAEVTDPPPPPGEVAVAGPDTPGRYQAGELAMAAGMTEWRFSWRVSHEGVAFGNAILSRHPLPRVVALALPPADRHDELRTALLADISLPEGRVSVATTHLNFLWDHSHVRQVQVAALCRWLASERAPDTPAVLTGDLNADPMSDEVRMLTGRAVAPVAGFGFHDAWEVAGDGLGPTWARANSHTPTPPIEPDKRIDYVLCAHPLPDGRGIPVSAERFGMTPDGNGHHPSDHFGVLADVTVTPLRSRR